MHWWIPQTPHCVIIMHNIYIYPLTLLHRVRESCEMLNNSITCSDTRVVERHDVIFGQPCSAGWRKLLASEPQIACLQKQPCTTCNLKFKQSQKNKLSTSKTQWVSFNFFLFSGAVLHWPKAAPVRTFPNVWASLLAVATHTTLCEALETCEVEQPGRLNREFRRFCRVVLWHSNLKLQLTPGYTALFWDRKGQNLGEGYEKSKMRKLKTSL